MAPLDEIVSPVRVTLLVLLPVDAVRPMVPTRLMVAAPEFRVMGPLVDSRLSPLLRVNVLPVDAPPLVRVLMVIAPDVVVALPRKVMPVEPVGAVPVREIAPVPVLFRVTL